MKESFPRGALAAYEKVRAETNPITRSQLMQDLAEEALEDYDASDAGYCEDYHERFEDMLTAKLAYERASMRVARMVYDTIKMEKELSVPPSGPNASAGGPN